MGISANKLSFDDWNAMLVQSSTTDFDTGRHKYIAYHQKNKTYHVIPREQFVKGSGFKKLDFSEITCHTVKLSKQLRVSDEDLKSSSRALMKMSVCKREKMSLRGRFFLCRIWRQFCERIYHLFKGQCFRPSFSVASRFATRHIEKEPILKELKGEWLNKLASLSAPVATKQTMGVTQEALNDFFAQLEQGYCSATLAQKALQIFPQVGPDQIVISLADETRANSFNSKSHYNVLRFEMLLKALSDKQLTGIFRGLFNQPEPSPQLFLDIICAIGSFYETDNAKFISLATRLISAAIEQEKIGLLIHFREFLPQAYRLWGEDSVKEWTHLFACVYVKFAIACKNENNSRRYEDMLTQAKENNVAILQLALETRGWTKFFDQSEGTNVELWCSENAVEAFLLK